METASDELEKRIELKNENQFGLEKSKMEHKLNVLKAQLDEMSRQLNAEVENSNEKSAEFVEQKSKLMEQVKILF